MRKYLFLLVIVCFFGLSAKKNNSQPNGFIKGCFNVSYNYYPSFSSEINSYVKGFGLKEFDENVFLYGVSLQSNMNSALGLGIEYMFGGDDTGRMVDLVDQDQDPVTLDRSVKYELNFWNLAINYRKSLYGSLEFFGILKGGYGEIEIILSQDYGDQTFEDMWDSYDPESYLEDYNRSSVFNTPVYVFSAENGIRFFATNRIAIGLTVGYTYCFASDNSELNYGFESIKNVPDLDFEGMNYGAGLFFGF